MAHKHTTLSRRNFLKTSVALGASTLLSPYSNRDAFAALESGQADFVNDVPVHEVARLQRHPRIRIDRIEGLEMYFLMMNVAYKPFDNKLVRQAVNYAIDAPAIVKNIFDGLGYTVDGPVG